MREVVATEFPRTKSNTILLPPWGMHLSPNGVFRMVGAATWQVNSDSALSLSFLSYPCCAMSSWVSMKICNTRTSTDTWGILLNRATASQAVITIEIIDCLRVFDLPMSGPDATKTMSGFYLDSLTIAIQCVELFSWVTCRTIRREEAARCAKREPGRSWEAIDSELANLGMPWLLRICLSSSPSRCSDSDVCSFVCRNADHRFCSLSRVPNPHPPDVLLSGPIYHAAQ